MIIIIVFFISQIFGFFFLLFGKFVGHCFFLFGGFLEFNGLVDNDLREWNVDIILIKYQFHFAVEVTFQLNTVSFGALNDDTHIDAVIT